MFGNHYSFAIEVADEETGVYVAQIVSNEPYELVNNLLKNIDLLAFRVVVFKQDVTSVYRRGDFVDVDLSGLDLHQRHSELFSQIDLLIK